MTTTEVKQYDNKLDKMTEEFSVKVTDYNCSNVNPSPIKIPKNGELLEEFLSPRKLQTLTGVDNLDTVEYLEMRVNTEQMSLGNFGMYLPNLSQLKLSGSIIPSIRDLGTSLYNLQVLWMPQCALSCLDGLVTMTSIRELYLAYNEVDDISPCGMLENLELLDLEGNLISDHSQLHYLSMCSNLSRLNLEGNPVANDRTTQEFRELIKEILPQLQYLNDHKLLTSLESVTNSGDNNRHNTESPSPSLDMDNSQDLDTQNPQFQQHWDFIHTVLQESGLLASAPLTRDTTALSSSTDDSPHTNTTTTFSRDSGRFSLNSAAGYRPFTTLGHRPITAHFNSTLGGSATGSMAVPASFNNLSNGNVTRRPYTADFFSNSRPNTGASSGNDSLLDDEGDSHRDIESHLTAGKPVCGSLARSLVKRSIPKQSHQLESPRSVTIDDDDDVVGATNTSVRPKTAAVTQIKREGFSSKKCDEILEELNQWRQNYAKTRSTIEAHRAPQVLTLECSDNPEEQNTTVKRPSTATPLKSSTKLFAQPSSARKLSQSSLKSGSKIQLNPLKSPKPIQQPSIISPNQKTASISTNSNTTTNPVANQQLSRIRRQLMQAGAVSGNLTPSKPQLKKE